MTKGLALSGGGARGSFQMGAIDCLYTAFGYRPDVLASTSVGSVNALVLAQAETDAEKLDQMKKLRSIWLSLTGPGDFYKVQQWLADLTQSQSLDFGGGLSIPVHDLLTKMIFVGKVALNLSAIQHSTSLAMLDPLEAKMKAPGMVDANKLAKGVPLRMASVSLESGRLRYATGDGRFLEDDNATPVASALPPNAIPGVSLAQVIFANAIAAVQTKVAAIANEDEHGDPHTTKWRNLVRLRLELDRALWQADAAFDALAAANAALPTPLNAPVDPIQGALASAAIPGIFGPYKIGEEHYVDGGVREVVPVRAAVQLGATEVIAIVSSTQHLPKTGDKSAQNFAASLLSSLTDVTLKEIVDDDLAGRGIGNVKVTSIIPSFDVHDTAVVDMGLIRISMGYGYMRAADVVSGLNAAATRDAMRLSDAVARLRTDTHLLSYLWTNPNQPGAHQMLEEFRFRKWLLRKLVEARLASKVALPDFAMLWFQGWEDGSQHIPFTTNPWNAFSTAQTTPAQNPITYVPDGKVFDQQGDLGGLYLVQAGAVFRSTPTRIGAIAGSTPAFTVPIATSQFLPTVPVAGTVVAELAAAGDTVETGGTWFVDGRRRYELNAAAIAVMTLPPTTSVPVGGLKQIPAGGDPYWVGGLVVSDSQPALIHSWDPTPMIEGNTATIELKLWNRANRVATVSAIDITVDAGGGAATFTPLSQLPITIANGQMFEVPVTFTATASGPITGTVAVDCDDPIAKKLRIPMSTSVLPLGAHGELSLSPSAMSFSSSLVGSTTGQYLTITNSGGRQALYNAAGFEGEQPPGQFALPPVGVSGSLDPGKSAKLYVAYVPTNRGTAQASLAIEMSSQTDQLGVSYRQRYTVPVSGSARMPTVFLASHALPPVVPVRPRPPIDPHPVLLEPELRVLDFGAVQPGRTASASFWVRNTGDAALTVQPPINFNHSHFDIVIPATLPVTLPPGGDVEVPCVFLAESTPGVVSSGRFQIVSDDPIRPGVMLDLIGRAAGPHLTPPNETYDFGSLTQPTTATLTFRSDGTSPVTLRSLTLSGSAFTATPTPTVPAQLAPGAQLNIDITPKGHGPLQETLLLEHDGNPSHKSFVILKAQLP